MPTVDKKVPWWQSAVFYQIYPRSFQDSNGDGIGDLSGILSRLNYLNDGTKASLGVDAIWLSPFYASPMRDFGYDVSDYCSVDQLFGNLADFDALLSEAHKRDIRVIIDLVPNHTSSEHTWFAESRSSRTNLKRNWYVWADGRSNGAPPNNWLSAFRRQRSAWTYDSMTHQWYMHSFLASQPDLNWSNPEVKEAMWHIMKFWLDRGVDGFRVDVAHRLGKDPALRDNHEAVASYHRHFCHPTERQHNMDWPCVHEVLQELSSILDFYSDRMLVGEVPIKDHRRLFRYLGLRDDELDLVFDFSFFDQPWDGRSFGRVIDLAERALPSDAWPSYMLGNHDLPRLATRYGRESVRLAAMKLLTLRGTPFLYYGDEIGMCDVPIPHDHAQDPDGRDPQRTPMQWSKHSYAGFSETKPWLPIGHDIADINAEDQASDPTSLLSLYKRLVWYLKQSSALRFGSYRALSTRSQHILAFVREARDEILLVVLNYSDKSIKDCLAISGTGRVEVCTSADRDGDMVDIGSLSVERNGGLLIKLLGAAAPSGKLRDEVNMPGRWGIV